jgi:hypothetical protein
MAWLDMASPRWTTSFGTRTSLRSSQRIR